MVVVKAEQGGTQDMSAVTAAMEKLYSEFSQVRVESCDGVFHPDELRTGRAAAGSRLSDWPW